MLVYDVWSGHPVMQLFAICVPIGILVGLTAAFRTDKQLDRRALYAMLSAVLYALFQILFFFKTPLFTWPRYFVGYYMGYTLLATWTFGFLVQFCKERGRVWRALAVCVCSLGWIAGFAQVRLYRDNPYV